MKIPIKVLLNRVTVPVKDDFDIVAEFFKRKTNGKVELDFIYTESDLKNLGHTDPIAQSGLCCITNVHPQLKPEGYPITVFCFNQNDFTVGMTSNMDTWLAPGQSLINLVTSESNDKIGWIWKSLSHEILHAMFPKAFFAGATQMYDPMDSMIVNGVSIPYYKNYDPEAPDGNYAKAFELLEPWWDKMFPEILEADVVIVRQKETRNQTLGKLTATRSGATFTCDTLELPWKNNAKNISCIPKGLYDVRYTFSWRFKKYTYEIMKVPNRDGIRIHSANYFSELNGCIALGSGLVDLNKDGELDIINSRATIKAFEGFMGKNSFKLLIK